VILLLRHGRTEANARGLLLGRADPVLDDVGREQAQAAAEEVARTATVGRIVSSPLARCRATAGIVADVLGVDHPAEGDVPVEVEVDERWIELDYGELDGTPLSEVPPATWATWQGDVGWAPPGGETLAELGARVRSACDELHDDVVVVSHVSPIKAAVAWALGVGDELSWRLHVTPASVTRIAVRDGGGVLTSFNWTVSP